MVGDYYKSCLVSADCANMDVSHRDMLDSKQVHTNSSNNRHIYITGTQQCKGLALHLIKKRKNSITKSQDYNITSFIKPYATSDDFVDIPSLFDLSINNYLVLCVGENDKNPTKLLMNYAVMLKNVNNLHVIVLSIFKNKSLNEIKLNHSLKTICANFPNCTFISTNSFSSKHIYHSELCNQINMIVDSKDYTDKYLSFKNKLSFKINLETTKTYRKGTIPYYFPVISQKLNDTFSITKHGEKNNFNFNRFFRK